jgi:hypothetical protein
VRHREPTRDSKFEEFLNSGESKNQQDIAKPNLLFNLDGVRCS